MDEALIVTLEARAVSAARHARELRSGGKAAPNRYRRDQASRQWEIVADKARQLARSLAYAAADEKRIPE